MGASQRAIHLANATIRGAFLVLKPESLRILPPPEEKRKRKGHQRHHYNRERRGYQGCPKWQQQVIVTKKEQPSCLCPDYSDRKILAPASYFINDVEISSTATSSLCYSQKTEDEYPGLPIDLVFLDEEDNAADNHARNFISFDHHLQDNLVQCSQNFGPFGLIVSTSVWTKTKQDVLSGKNQI